MCFFYKYFCDQQTYTSMSKKIFENRTPSDIDKYIKLSQDKSDYKNRLIAIDFLSKFKCYESKKELYRLMKTDKIFDIKEQAFRALQNFGEQVKLTKKKKGKTVKAINDKLLILHNSFNGDPYTLTEFKIKFKHKYPDIYDIYSYEKKSKFDDFVQNSIKTFPQKKINHNYSVKVLFKDSINKISKETIEIEHKKSDKKDELIVEKNQITINCNRTAKINLINIVFSDNNTIHNQIIKSLIYYYIKADNFNEIQKISIHRIKKTGEEEVILSLPSSKILIEQILSDKFQGIDILPNDILVIFKKEDKAESLQYALTYLLKSKITSEPSERFEKLWKSFNSIYYYIGNGANENECHRLMRKFIIDNKSKFSKSVDKVKIITYDDLNEKVRFADLLQNDYDSKEKIVSFIAFIYRYENELILKSVLENLEHFNSYLKTVFTVDKVENKFNKFSSIKHIYQTHKSSSDPEIIFKIVKRYLEDNIKNPKINTEIELVVFLCIKYSYYLRNKIFHAEKEDLTFRFAKNNLILEIDWINDILETIITELIVINSLWIKHIQVP